MQAIVLAGGLGTRLRGVIGDLPKPMAPVGGLPFLHRLLADLAQRGFTDVVLSVGHLHEKIVDYFGDRFAGLSVRYAIEASPLGTGGAIRQALDQAASGPCFVLNGDTYASVDFPAMRAAHTASGATLTMAVCDLPDIGRFGALTIDDGVVTSFREKGDRGPGSINAGVYLLDRAIFAGYPTGERFSFESDFLAPHLATLRPRAFRTAGAFIDIGIPEDYERAAAFFERLSAAGPG